MGSRKIRMIFILLWFLRLFGGFPYTWKRLPRGQLEVKKSILAIIWTFMIVGFLTTISISCVTNAPNNDTTLTYAISSYVLNYITYSISAVFFPYLALRSHKVANILRRMSETHVDLDRRIIAWEDYIQGLSLVGIVSGITYVTIDSTTELSSVPLNIRILLYHIPATIIDPLIEFTAITFGLLLYFLLKLLSIESEIAVLTLSPSTGVSRRLQGNDFVQWVPTPTIPRYMHKTPSENTKDGIILKPSTADSKLEAQVNSADASKVLDDAPFNSSTSRRLLSLDDIVVELVEYAGPPVIMILLSSTVNATVMLYLTITKMSYYYLAYIIVKVLSVAQVTFIPDSLWCKRIKCLRLVRRLLTTHTTSINTEIALRDVEKVLSTSTHFLVCRLFTLDRHIILSVASSIVTYLVIALQFGNSERPQTTRENCTQWEI